MSCLLLAGSDRREWGVAGRWGHGTSWHGFHEYERNTNILASVTGGQSSTADDGTQQLGLVSGHAKLGLPVGH